MLPLRSAHPARGFSLIEILVVITIIALLMTFTAVTVGRYREAGRNTECQTRIESLALSVASYEDRMGDYPPSSLSALGVKEYNAVNEGIEALAAALRSRDYGGQRPDERWLANADDDHADGLDLADGSNALLEIVDPWGQPFLYFVHTGYDEAGTYRIGDDVAFEDIDVRALKNPLTGAYHKFESFQIRSVGPDGLADTEDDLANFEIAHDDEP